MAKLYPPYIEGTLPAFCLESGDGEKYFTIPFAHNQAVGSTDMSNTMYIKVKTVQNDTLIGAYTGTIKDNLVEVSYTMEGEDGVVSGGGDNKWKLKVGQYYKLQLAYTSRDNGEIGYYSTVGVIKCTSEPTVTIIGLDESIVKNNQTEFVGQYEQSKGGDVTEKVFSSKFTITDLKGNEIATTGEVLHNVENNPNSYTSIDIMKFNRDLEFGEIYKIWYTVTTNNGLVRSSPKYLLTQQKSLSMDFDGSLKAELNYEEGFIDISTVVGEKAIVDGSFVLSREDSLNPGVWEELTRFILNHEHPSKLIFRDFTIEQGKTYTYSIQQYNDNGIFSERKKSNKIYADFEDMFLFDGKRQLKLRFNPQVGSFKTQLAESRSETIGSKYPFFFRNARVGYKTFPINALISMLIDDNEFFTTYEEILREDFSGERHKSPSVRKVNKDPYDYKWEINKNYTSERLFKLKVLDWFNDGKVKLFKSPGEGNYIVRLMETSMSPENALGRMLHNITSTAYECADCIYTNLIKYDIIEDVSKSVSQEDTYVESWNEESIKSLYDELFDENGEQQKDFFPNTVINSPTNEHYSENLLKSDLAEGKVYTDVLKFTDLMPGTKIRLVFAQDGKYEQTNDKDYEDIIIGATGNYFADGITPVYGIYMVQTDNSSVNSIPAGSRVAGAGAQSYNYPSSLEGTILYQYRVPVRTKFNSIVYTDTSIGEYKQFVGDVTNLVEDLSTTRDEVTHISMSRYFKRPVEYLFYKTTEITNFPIDAYTENYNVDGSKELVGNYKDKLYWNNEFRTGDVFTEKDHMKYSPFSIYVLRNSMVNGQDIVAHIWRDIQNQIEETSTHVDDHMFEKYYIDRYIFAQSPEEMLTERTLLAQRLESISNIEDPEQDYTEEINIISNALANNPVYLFDPWIGKVYKVGENYLYNPTIIYNKEQIDLREIQRYDLDDLEPIETEISVGNGVYGDVFYQQVTTHYALETADSDVIAAKEEYTRKLNNLVTLRNAGGTPSYAQLDDLDEAYETYNDILNTAIENWNKRLTDLEE